MSASKRYFAVMRFLVSLRGTGLGVGGCASRRLLWGMSRVDEDPKQTKRSEGNKFRYFTGPVKPTRGPKLEGNGWSRIKESTCLILSRVRVLESMKMNGIKSRRVDIADEGGCKVALVQWFYLVLVLALAQSARSLAFA